MLVAMVLLALALGLTVGYFLNGRGLFYALDQAVTSGASARRGTVVSNVLFCSTVGDAILAAS